MRLKTYKMAMSILSKFLTLKWNISRSIWHIEVGDGSLFCIFHALSFEHNFFFDRRFPLRHTPVVITIAKVFMIICSHICLYCLDNSDYSDCITERKTKQDIFMAIFFIFIKHTPLELIQP